MKQANTWICAVATALLSSTALAAPGGNLEDNRVLRSSGGEIVHSLEHRTCVRTEFEEGVNVCAPAPVKVVQAPPAPVVRTVLSTDERVVYFDFDSAALSDVSKNRLDGVATKLSGAKDVQSADIVGYADRIGSSSYNVNLSRLRAENVKNYLAQRGYLNTQVVDVRGLGESNSKTNCDPNLSREEQISCLSADRRVEIEVKYLEQQRVY